MRRRRYPAEEFARRGKEIYEHCVKPTLRPEDYGKFALIDIESGDFEIDESELAASDRLLARHPEAQSWIERIGHRAAYYLGFRGTYRRIDHGSAD